MALLKDMRYECGFPVAKRTSWTHDNPGRKFIACKFYNHETGQRGCDKFEWVDEGVIDWQRDVTNVLVAEKHRLCTDLNIMRARLSCVEHEKERLAKEVEKLNNKLWRRNNTAGMEKGDGVKYGSIICVCVIVSVVVSFIFVKLFG